MIMPILCKNLIVFVLYSLSSIGATHFDEVPGIDINNTPHQYLREIEVEDSFEDSDKDVHELMPGTEKLMLSKGTSTARLEIFCYEGEPQTIAMLLKTVELVIVVPEDNFHYYEGTNASSIRHQYKDDSWLSFSPWKPSSFRLNIYNYSCVGIQTVETFTVQLKVRHVDLWRVVTLAIGTGLFFSAPILAHNVVFHYMTGVTVGVVGSLLVVVFLVSRLIPKKTGAFAVLIGGWGLVLYTLQHVWLNCLHFIQEYKAVAAGYVTLAGLISFAVVYRWGPIENSRSLKLVQWSLQLVGMSLIFISSQCKEFTVALILILLTHYNIPQSWKFRMKTYWFRYFPPKQRFLTEEEYLEQSRTETKKSLEDLREFCHSPDCNAWKTMRTLNTPQRFAEFADGSCHLTDDEIMSYESAIYVENPFGGDDDMLTDDEDEQETPVRFRKKRN